MELVLVRHPQPEVAPGICYGRTDLGASPAAIAGALARLNAAGLPGDLPIYASPLRRCADFAARLGAPVTFDARLAEMDFGTWEMRTWDDIARAEIDAWTDNLLYYRPGGGETVMEVAQRVASFLATLRHNDRALVVCHAGTMRLLSALHAGGTVEEAALRAAARPHRIDYGGVMTLKD